MTNQAKATINIEPIGVNNSQKLAVIKGRPVRFKTKETKKFEIDFLNQFDYYMESFAKLAATQAELCCPVHVSIVLKKPIYRKGTSVISKKSVDIDGPVKIIIDLVCNAISMDDSFITRLEVEKVHSLIPQIDFEMRLLYS